MERTRGHINRVIRNMELMEGFRGFTKEELRNRGEHHDESKFVEPEVVPYIMMCKMYAKNITYVYPPGVEEQTKAARRHHLQTSRHHPESYPDVNQMQPLDVVEMVCDWAAISLEFDEFDYHIREKKKAFKKFQFDEEHK